MVTWEYIGERYYYDQYDYLNKPSPYDYHKFILPYEFNCVLIIQYIQHFILEILLSIYIKCI